MPVRVRVAELAALAMPKSVTLARSPGPMRMFPGLTSRWTSRWAWAAARARATCSPSAKASLQGSRPRAAIRSARVSPSTSSITMKALPPSSP